MNEIFLTIFSLVLAYFFRKLENIEVSIARLNIQVEVIQNMLEDKE